jgi:putative membrane protein
MYEVHRAHDGHGLIGLLVCLILVGAVVAAVMLFMQSRRPPQNAGQTASVTPPVDPALAELRLRYARGELDRAEYVQRAIDLGDTHVSRSAEPPPTESAVAT